MSRHTQTTESRYFFLAITLIFLAGTYLRFWNLGEIPITFDEVFIPKLGYGYLIGKPSFPFVNAQPPMSNNIFAGSIWLYYQMPWTESLNLSKTTYEQLNPLSFRWINAATGSILPLLFCGITWLVTNNRLITVLVCLLAALEGTLIVDSRFAMNSPYILLFGFSGIWLFLKAINCTLPRLLFLSSGLAFGLAIAVKWSALGLLAGLIGVVFFLQLLHLVDTYRPAVNSSAKAHLIPSNEIVSNLIALRWWVWLPYVVIATVAGYILAWIPDMLVNSHIGFWGTHEHILNYHKEVDANAHASCSKWYSWPLMLKPIAYYFSIGSSELDQQVKIFKDVHNFGNPAIYWMSTLSILVMMVMWVLGLGRWFTIGKHPKHFFLCSFIVAGYCANLLPWMLVDRCLFLYHYQPASIFAIITLAWALGFSLTHRRIWIKSFGVVSLCLILMAFVYWSPNLLGLELTPDAFYQRMWLKSWI